MSEAEARPLRRDAVVNRERVLDAATVEVLRHGERVPMAAIAASAEVGVGTIYRHFPTRENLYAALVRRSFELALANAEHAAAAADPVDGIAEFFRAAVRDRDRFVLPLHGGPSVVDAGSRRLQREIRGHIASILKRGVAAGSIRSDVTPGDIVVTGALLSRGLPNSGTWATVARRQIDLFVSGLRP